MPVINTASLLVPSRDFHSRQLLTGKARSLAYEWSTLGRLQPWPQTLESDLSGWWPKIH